MKRAILVVSILFVTQLWSQQVPEPQYVYAFYALDSKGTLIELDHQKVSTFHTKTKLLPGYATVKMLAEIKPAHAQVRLAAVTQFVVQGRSAFDPSSLFELRLLKVSKDHREFPMAQGHGTVFAGAGASMLEEGVLPIRFEQYGTNSYRITPEKPLSPGEYALAVRWNVTELYCFGVDR